MKKLRIFSPILSVMRDRLPPATPNYPFAGLVLDHVVKDGSKAGSAITSTRLAGRRQHLEDTVCPRSLAHFYIGTHCIKMNGTSWTYRQIICCNKVVIQRHTYKLHSYYSMNFE